MSNSTTFLKILVVDSVAERGATLLGLLATNGHCGVHVTDASQGQTLLTEQALAAALIPWPQDNLDLAVVGTILADLPLLLVINDDGPHVALPEMPILHCYHRNLAGQLELLIRLRQAEQTLEAVRRRLHMGARSMLLGDLIGGIAHDLNNPLTAVLGNAELLPKQPSDEDQQGVEQIIASARRAQGIVQSLLVIARSRPGQRQWIDSAALIHSAIELIQATLRSHGIRMQVDLAPNMPYIWGEVGQLQQALLHVLQNTIQVMQSLPRKVLSLQGVRASTSDGEALLIELRDSEAALVPALDRRLREPTSSIWPVEQGADPGLLVSRQIIERAGGSIELLATPPAEAGIRIWLPLQDMPITSDDQAEGAW